MGWAARAHKSHKRWGLMKSICLSTIELYTLREVIQTPPTSSGSERKGYSTDDLESLDTVCRAVDARIGGYRKDRRALAQEFDRRLRAVRRIASRDERSYQEQLINDDGFEALETLNARVGIDQRAVVSLEDAEMKWLQDNWRQRTDWLGIDETRAMIRAITQALKEGNLIEWKPAEKEHEPDVADFDRPNASESPNGKVKEHELALVAN